MIGKRSLLAFNTMLKITFFFRLNTIIGTDGIGGERILFPTKPMTSIFGKWEVSRLGFKCMMMVIFANFIFGWIRIVQSVLIFSDNFQDIMFQLFVQSISLLSCVINSTMLLAMDDVAWIISTFLKYEKHLADRYQVRAVRDRALPYIIFFATCAISEIPAVTILYLANMDKPVYFGSLRQYIPKEYAYTRYAAFVFFLLYETMMISATVFSSLLLCFICILILTTGRFWLLELRPPKLELRPRTGPNELGRHVDTPQTRQELRYFSRVINTFRCWQIILIAVNRIAWMGITGQHLAIPTLLITSAFSTIQFWGWHNFETIATAISYLIYPCAVAIFFTWVFLIQPQMAKLYIASEEVRWAWYAHLSKETGYERRIKRGYIRSFRDIQIEVGWFFYYKTTTMPQVMDECVDNTINLLMAS